MELQFVNEDNFNHDIKDFYSEQWPSANEEVFGFTDQSKWRMEEHLITARFNNQIVGVAQFRIIGGIGYLGTLLVKEQYRGKKMVGQALLDQFENTAKEKACHKLGLKSYVGGRATTFFANNGYIEEGILKNDIHGIDWIMMAKFL